MEFTREEIYLLEGALLLHRKNLENLAGRIGGEWMSDEFALIKQTLRKVRQINWEDDAERAPWQPTSGVRE